MSKQPRVEPVSLELARSSEVVQTWPACDPFLGLRRKGEQACLRGKYVTVLSEADELSQS